MDRVPTSAITVTILTWGSGGQAGEIAIGVDVDAKYVIARVGQTGAGDEAYIAGSKYCDSHAFPECPGKGARSGILTNWAYQNAPSRYRNDGTDALIRLGCGVAARAPSHRQ